MARVAYTIRRKGSTVTFKYGRYVESFDIAVLGWYETYEHIRVAAITAGLSLNQTTLEQLLREVKELA